ncbi:hypothetical protein F3Y22_tig00110264pilonHSYRG00336 [Hibiscus syriacus]|uniref:Uncharacterized protein n=1 Tax=Hibiscus syriacus TaxID=106335 RepID=A0A6A3BA99_HIBSY|nr:hypothetical protein F3Y22_tig00110264pilonHSYRG00336 [Hibiscus syriacus]
MTKEFQENGQAFRGRSRSRTLGEMLALSDHAKRANFRGPFGISSRVGSKNGGVGDLLKSRSQSYPTIVGSPITRTSPKAFHVDSCMSTRPVFPWSRRKDCPKQRNSGSYDIKDRKVSTEDCVVPESSMYSAVSRSIVSDMVVAVETQDAAKTTGSHTKHRLESMDCIMPEKGRDSSFRIPVAWIQQEDVSMKISEECGTDLDFLVTSETANQSSPVSVLETPFVEENSLSSKCLSSVIASLNDVKRQLEFLKSESVEEYTEGQGMVVSSDNENVVEEPLKYEVNEYPTK